ncbi:nucleotidyltransferase family protein [Crocosphaera sp. UHCC 0190]|uniref:nucleotidyltransferase family protein n=1 Tax=Crocosphaera sp. UHCC 0190 TaxID=3110246 RepID=UPI002B21B97F|nr:nucleotidyltransferase family protein [Crocosphaera sp. UHCC 0190]MEA5508762.1 nucleotidyltransferase family protein [Crocosphaera sp. UHCC 0190]
MIMERDKVLNILKINYQIIENYGIKSLAIFGSVARNEATVNSDVDILVEFTEKVTFDRYMDLKFYLEDCLGTKVDLVTHNMLKSPIRQTVEQEAIYVS